jgi:hypothetical protein
LWLPSGHECNEQVSPIHTWSILHVQACWVLIHSSQPMSCTWYFEIFDFAFWVVTQHVFIHECVNTWAMEWMASSFWKANSKHPCVIGLFEQTDESHLILFFKHVFVCIVIIQIVLQESKWEDGTSSHKLSHLNKLSSH